MSPWISRTSSSIISSTCISSRCLTQFVPRVPLDSICNFNNHYRCVLRNPNLVFRIVLRNGLLVRRITYEPNRVRAHVTRFFIQYHFSYSVFAHCPHHLRFSLMTTLHVKLHPSNPTFRMVLRNGLLVSRITLWARSCSCKRHTFLISLQVFTHFLHPHQATRFSSSSMISFVLKCISHL